MKLSVLMTIVLCALLLGAGVLGVAKAQNRPDPLDLSRFTRHMSGLETRDDTVGTGEAAKRGDTVTVHYRGTFYTSGKTFDSSYDRGAPYRFTLGKSGVIQGWHEGIAGMHVGGKRTLVIPPDLAYGPEGRPPVIPPNSTLQFQVELLGVE